VQATWAPLDDSLNPCDFSTIEDPRYCLGINYTKEAVWAYNQRQTWRDNTMVYRPFTPHFSVPKGGVNPRILLSDAASPVQRQHGGTNADVWTVQNREIGRRIQPLLEEVANLTNDRPLPRYQMIIDPNQFVRARKSDGKRVWVPCEFDIAADGGSATLVGNDRAHWMDPALIDSVATPVLSAALPLLAKLTKPYLLLEGQRLQVAVKAQSITVPLKQEDDDAPEYVGLGTSKESTSRSLLLSSTTTMWMMLWLVGTWSLWTADRLMCSERYAKGNAADDYVVFFTNCSFSHTFFPCRLPHAGRY
jgi:hypothetical protein